MSLHAQDPHSWLETVWEALHGFREDCISEGDQDHDEQWDDICTAMAWITEAITEEDDQPAEDA